MADVVRRLPLSPQVSEALLMHTHRQGQLLALAIAYEQDDGALMNEICRQVGLSTAAVAEAYVTAIRWSDDIAREMGL
jgi:c-di-GMP-related signal transduction protein